MVQKSRTLQTEMLEMIKLGRKANDSKITNTIGTIKKKKKEEPHKGMGHKYKGKM